MRIVFWVDGGLARGLGHLSRAAALAEAFAAHGARCDFVLCGDDTGAAHLAAAGIRPCAQVPVAVGPLPVVLALAAGADAVVVDVARPIARWEAERAREGRVLVLVDDAGPGATVADVVVLPFAAAVHPRALVGPRYLPLRTTPLTRPSRDGAPVVLVSMGGSDPGGLALGVVEALTRPRLPPLALRVVANPEAPVWAPLCALMRDLGQPPPHATRPGAMGAHLAAADVAVLAMGVTVYEAMAAGVPPIVVCRTTGDEAHAASLARQGAAVSLGVDPAGERLASAVARLVSDADERARIGSCGRGLVDGRGAERVVDRVVALLRGRGGEENDVVAGHDA